MIRWNCSTVSISVTPGMASLLIGDNWSDNLTLSESFNLIDLRAI